ncbi:hypothetical protein LCGC14_1616400 [marine sediment metagenome]|uniref:Uncharacterized protein n=1 Tax=marine sediment metagenome TaxID=412755 RepID=A0A0F9L6Q1_9ZZZZ
MHNSKQMKKQTAELARSIDSNRSSIKGFKAQLVFYNEQIRSGNDLLPQLRKQIKRIKNGMPLWIDEVRKYELSLKTHQKRLLNQIHRFELLQRKNDILIKLEKLEV